MNSFLVQHVTYPLHEWLKGQKTTSAFDDAMLRNNWSAEKLRAFQLSAMQRLISCACEGSRYYREMFCGISDKLPALNNFADIQQLPFLTKEIIRSRGADLIAWPQDRRKELVAFSTGGSTGEPIRFFVDRGRIASEWAACWRARSWWGLKWGDRWIWLWGSPIELSTGDRVKGTLKRLRDSLLNRDLFSAFEMTPVLMQRYVDEIRKHPPAYIYAYASAAYLLAQFILRNRIDLSQAAPKVVFTTADTLYEHMRATIEEAFHCKVSVEYGSRDCGFVAHECPRGKLHIHSDRVFLEIIHGDKPAPAGERGEIVITNLDAYAMPFIRYRTGDVGSLDSEACPCGLAFPVLKSIEGRSSDFLLARGDKLIHGESVTHVMRQLNGVAAFRVIQENLESLELQIVLSPDVKDVDTKRIQAHIDALFGYPVAINFHYMQALPLLSSGKHRVVISQLTGRYFQMAEPQGQFKAESKS